MKDELDIFLKSLNKIKNSNNFDDQQIDTNVNVNENNFNSNSEKNDNFNAKISEILKEDNDNKNNQNIVQEVAKKTLTEDNKIDNQTDNKIDINLNHRDRVRNRFLETNKNIFQDYEILEMMLFFLIPRSDVKSLAKKMINYFGSFKNIFKANDFEIEKFVSNVKNFKFFLKLIEEINNRKLLANLDTNDILLNKDNFKQHCKEISFYDIQDNVYLILLDKNNIIIGHVNFSKVDFKNGEMFLFKKIFGMLLSKKELKNIFIFKNIKNIENNIVFNINEFSDEEKILLSKIENILNKFDIKIVNLF